MAEFIENNKHDPTEKWVFIQTIKITKGHATKQNLNFLYGVLIVIILVEVLHMINILDHMNAEHINHKAPIGTQAETAATPPLYMLATIKIGVLIIIIVG
ncbi:MAG: hypothetical protein CL489_14700 [Acidobacteria bacterium]|nr:hypothetical protein [Acidobacteriota bacterium]